MNGHKWLELDTLGTKAFHAMTTTATLVLKIQNRFALAGTSE